MNVFNAATNCENYETYQRRSKAASCKATSSSKDRRNDTVTAALRRERQIIDVDTRRNQKQKIEEEEEEENVMVPNEDTAASITNAAEDIIMDIDEELDEEASIIGSSFDRLVNDEAIQNPYMYRDGFDILKWIATLDSQNEERNTEQEVLKKRIIEESGNWKVKNDQFADAILEFMPLLREETLKNEFIKCISKIIPNCKETVISLSKFQHQVASVASFDCCPCDKTVYVESNTADQCSKCKAYRFTACKTCGSYDYCTHINRTAVKSLQYRPIISILRNLVSFPTFLNALCYTDPTSGVEGFVCDVMDSAVALSHLTEMRRSHSSRLDGAKNLRPIYILLQNAWDGAQVFKSKTSKFYPLVLTILNLPPSLRKIHAVGMFVLSLFTGSEG